MILIIPCFLGCKGQGKQLDDSNQKLFEDYLSSFKNQPLPHTIDKKEVARLRNYKDATVELADDFGVFVPAQLKKKDIGELRCISTFPSSGNFKAILILHKFVDRYENTVTKVYIVTHEPNGRVIDCKELAGYLIDSWEAYSNVLEDYRIEKYAYQYRMPEDTDMSKYFRLRETKSQFEIAEDGKISELNVTVTEGYFEASLNGYKLVKPVD
jgi:hypothetical protein